MIRHITNGTIIGDAYNSDYIACVLFSLFAPNAQRDECILERTLTNNIAYDANAVYVQEYIKHKIVAPMQRCTYIPSSVIAKLRLFLYNCGWLANKSILMQAEPGDFYKFTFAQLLNYKLHFLRVPADTDAYSELSNVNFDCIDINFDEIETSMLSDALKIWCVQNISHDNKFAYQFSQVPQIIPIRIINSSKTIDIMEGICFDGIVDKYQNKLIWELSALICYDKQKYYAIMYDNISNVWIKFSDKTIPSTRIYTNFKEESEQIASEVVFVLYKLENIQ